jgi:hypothetical protein
MAQTRTKQEDFSPEINPRLTSSAIDARRVVGLSIAGGSPIRPTSEGPPLLGMTKWAGVEGSGAKGGGNPRRPISVRAAIWDSALSGLFGSAGKASSQPTHMTGEGQ